MKKLIAIGIILLFVGMTISSTGFNLENQSVKPLSTGNILYVGGNGTGNYTSIQGAIDDASKGDTVYVYDDSSPYYENIEIDKPITLTGENKETTVIDGSGSGDVVYIRVYDKVTVSGFTIQKSGDEWRDAGINLINSYNTLITGNHISNNGCGIRLDDSPGNSITGNTIILNNGSGIYICELSYTVNISGNYISSNNGNGISIGFESMDITITNNTINSNNVTGIVIYNRGHTVINNNISNNNQGILLYEPDSNIIKNNFIGNRRHASFHIPFFGRNHWDSNYWDNWIGIGPKLIFGSNGFLGFLPWIQFDWHPATEPYDIGV